MTAPDLLSRIDAAIGLRPELADLLGDCRAEIVRLREAAAAPVVDDETAAMVARLHGGDGEILRAIGSALNAVYMERARGGKVSDQAEEVRVHRAVLEAIRPAADRLEALSAPVVDVTALRREIEVLRCALSQACLDGWADGIGAMGSYLAMAERGVPPVGA